MYLPGSTPTPGPLLTYVVETIAEGASRLEVLQSTCYPWMIYMLKRSTCKLTYTKCCMFEFAAKKI